MSYCSKSIDHFLFYRSPPSCIFFLQLCALIGFMCVFPAVTCPRTALCSLRRCTSRGECASSSVCPHTLSTSASGLTRRWADDMHRCMRLCCDAILYTFLLLTSLLSPQLLFDMDKEIFPMVVQAVVDEGEGELLCFYSTDLVGK